MALFRSFRGCEELPTGNADVLERVERVIADLESHRAVVSVPSLEDSHEQVNDADLDESVAAQLWGQSNHQREGRCEESSDQVKRLKRKKMRVTPTRLTYCWS